MLFSEPKIPQYYVGRYAVEISTEFQCSSASRKFLNGNGRHQRLCRVDVSVLFSEPKIPQSKIEFLTDCIAHISFSALQRAENSSIAVPEGETGLLLVVRFSALQRAENSSIPTVADVISESNQFQCSSASRKFLNGSITAVNATTTSFQCSSASRKFLNAIAYLL